MFFGGFPFEEFGAGMGQPGGGGGPKKDVDNKKFYEILGVSREANTAEIKKAYRKLAIQHHPDKGGDPEVFKNLSRAYEVLGDSQKREAYDQYGEEGIDGGGGAEAQDIFDLFFGGGGRRRGAQQKKKGEDIVSHLKVSLPQLYKGATRKLAVNRDILCSGCDGEGGPKGAKENCSGCRGKGIKVIIRQLGPMIQQMQSKCDDCNGEGSFIPPGKLCKSCHGQKTIKNRKVLEIHIDPGAPSNHKITFAGEADRKPGEEPGDVIFVLDEQDHPMFKRKGRDLLMEREITLYEALTGFTFYLDSLDDRKLKIACHPSQITRPGDVMCVPGEGMPTHRNPFSRGNLIIAFTIKFPNSEDLTDNAREILKRVLPQPRPMHIDEADELVEEHFVQPYSASNNDYDGRSGEAYDEDDERMGGGGAQRVQCRQS